MSDRIAEVCELLAEQPRLEEAPRIPAAELGPQSFAERIGSRGYPAVLTGFLTGTGAAGMGFDDLVAAVGDFELSPKKKSKNVVNAYLDRDFAEACPPMTVRSYVEGLSRPADARSQKLYFLYSSVELPAETFSRLGLPAVPWVPGEEMQDPRIWIGRRGTGTRLHVDTVDNFALQVIGRKIFTLFPPRDCPYLDLDRVRSSGFRVSAMGLGEVDAGRFPLLRKARPVHVELSPGDVLFLPTGWAHAVENAEDAVMVNWWMKQDRLPLVLRNGG